MFKGNGLVTILNNFYGKRRKQLIILMTFYIFYKNGVKIFFKWFINHYVKFLPTDFSRVQELSNSIKKKKKNRQSLIQTWDLQLPFSSITTKLQCAIDSNGCMVIISSFAPQLLFFILAVCMVTLATKELVETFHWCYITLHQISE